MIYLDQEFSRHFAGADPFLMLQAMEGTIYRRGRGRKTLQFSMNGKSYFLKLHSGIGWREIIKNLVQLRLPVLGASNEWRAISRLQELGVPTLKAVAYGSRGLNPASRQSFIVTEELGNTISLEDFCKDWSQHPPSPGLRRRLIERVAQISRSLHDNGVCHRDFYLCHFLLHKDNLDSPRLSLIDLHRVLIKKRLSSRWLVKDIAGLHYSAKTIGLSDRDRLRFIRHYCNKGLKYSLEHRSEFWKKVERRANRMTSKLGPAF